MARVELCCATCFGDRGLRRSIIPALSSAHGRCDYCLSEDVDLTEPVRLGDVFGLLVGTYEPDPEGRSLVELFKADWDLFHHPKMDDARARALLAEVLNNGEIVRQRFSPSPRFASDRLLLWEELRAELMHRNRYFPATPLEPERLGELLGHLIADEVPTEWFRARLQSGAQPFPIDEMGAPPARVAGHGRANPAGIPYLYLGSTPETAISEVRPHPGERACVARFVTPDQLNLVDLRQPRRLVSPFVLTDEREIGLLRSDITFLERLGDELTRPVVPQGALIDYVPSQYLCEFIKTRGYAGVLYRSSVSDGVNLALFSPGLATGHEVRAYEVSRVVVDASPV